MREKSQREKVEDYLLSNRHYALNGMTRKEVQKELLLSDEEMNSYFTKKQYFTVGEAIELLLKIEKENFKKEEDK